MPALVVPPMADVAVDVPVALGGARAACIGSPDYGGCARIGSAAPVASSGRFAWNKTWRSGRTLT